MLFQRIPWVNDTQSAFLLLSMCGATRANFWLRAVRPKDTEDLARRHDENVWACLREILGTLHASAAAHVLSTLSLSAGSLGLVSAVRVRAAAHWASWANFLRMVKQRNPRTARMTIRQLEADDPVSCFVAVNKCRRMLMPWAREEPEPSQPNGVATESFQEDGGQVLPRFSVASSQ